MKESGGRGRGGRLFTGSGGSCQVGGAIIRGRRLFLIFLPKGVIIREGRFIEGRQLFEELPNGSGKSE